MIKKSFKRRLAACVMSLVMIGSVASTTMVQASAAETEFKLTSSEYSAQDLLELDDNTAAFVQDVFDFALDSIPSPLAKFLIKEGMSAFNIRIANEKKDVNNDKEEIKQEIINNCNAVKEAVEDVSKQSDAQYQSLNDKANEALSLEKMKKFNDEYSELNTFYSKVTDRVERECANGKNRLYNGKDSDRMAAYEYIFGKNLDSTYQSGNTSLRKLNDSLCGANDTTKTHALTEWLNYNKNTTQKAYRENGYKFSSLNSAVPDAEQLYNDNKVQLGFAESNIRMSYQTLIALAHAQKEIYEYRDSSEESINNQEITYQNKVLELTKIFYGEVNNNGNKSENINDSFAKAYALNKDVFDNSDEIKVSGVARRITEPSDLIRFMAESAKNGNDVTITLRHNWKASADNGLADIAPGTQAAAEEKGFTPEGGVFIPENGKVLVYGNSHSIDMSLKNNAAVFTLGKNASLSLYNMDIIGGKYGIYTNKTDGAQSADINCSIFDGCATAVNFSANSSGAVNLKLSTFANGSNGAVVIGNNTKYDIQSCEFKSNKTSGSGAALNAGSNGSVSDTKFTRNSSNGNGGAVCGTGEAKFDKCVFNMNSSDSNGGAVCNVYNIHNSIFTANTAKKNGGAFYEDNEKLATIKSTSFVNNSCSGKGGALYFTGTKSKDWIIYSQYRTSTHYEPRDKYDVLTSVSATGNKSDGNNNDIYLNCVVTTNSKWQQAMSRYYEYNIQKADIQIHGAKLNVEAPSSSGYTGKVVYN